MNNKYFTLSLTLLLVLASAFAMGCTDSGVDVPSEDEDTTTPDNAFTGDGVRGNIIFDEPVSSFENATIYLSVEDVSLQDVSSVTMSENSITGVSMDADNVQPVEYLIYHPQLQGSMSYSLSVHVDIDGDSSLSTGDYYSTWHNAVPTEAGMHDLDVHVEMI